MSFLEKYYKHWSIPWMVQQFVLVIRQGRLRKVSFKTLWNDYQSSRQVNITLRKRSSGLSDPETVTVTGKPGESLPGYITCLDVAQNDLSALNHYFDQVYVINLARRTDRRETMIRKLTQMKIRAEFFPAVDGSSDEIMQEFQEFYNTPIDPQNAHEMEIRLKRKVIISPGAWGILKTYRNLLTDAKEKRFKKILCLEDDVIFAKNFEELFLQGVKIIPDSWKVLYLGASQHTWEEGVDLLTPAGIFEETDPVRYYYPINTDGAFALGLSAEVIPFLLTETASMNCPLDAGALRSAAKIFKGECFVMKPNLVIADVRESDIRSGRKQSDFASIVHWDLSLYHFNH